MGDYEKLIELTESPEVQEGVDLPKVQLHKWLVLGQTEYLCEYGTLSDGHEKLTDAQKYAQALKEQYYLAVNMALQKSVGMEAQADILEAEEELEKEDLSPSKRLRLEAKLNRARANMLSALTMIEDQTRMIKFYAKKAAELKPKVEAQYPRGIEQAEADNWSAVFEYRMKKGGGHGIGERVDNVPLDPYTKARLGVKYGRPDAVAPLAVSEKERIKELTGGDVQRFLQITQKDLVMQESKLKKLTGS